MYAFAILIALALTLGVVHQTIDEILPFKTPAALTRTVAVLIAAGLVYAIDYSVFTAFGQTLRAEWMHPVLTGAVLVALGEVVRSTVAAINQRVGSAPVASVTQVRAA